MSEESSWKRFKKAWWRACAECEREEVTSGILEVWAEGFKKTCAGYHVIPCLICGHTVGIAKGEEGFWKREDALSTAYSIHRIFMNKCGKEAVEILPCPHHKEPINKTVSRGVLFEKKREIFEDGSYVDWKLYKGRPEGFKFWFACLYVKIVGGQNYMIKEKDGLESFAHYHKMMKILKEIDEICNKV